MIMENTLYWLWFTLKKDITPRQQKELLDKYKTAKAIYHTEDYGEGVKDELLQALCDKSLHEAEKVYRRIEEIGGYIVTIDDDDYPPMLKNLHHPPYVLYMRGEKLKWNEILTIAVVGTRNYVKYGKMAAEAITSSLAECGVVVVSGMARGIDSIANSTALKCGGKTVAVLGSGLDVIYPPENRELYEDICKNGVVMTELPPGARPNRENFPKRNRIMVGLSYGVIVCQAPEKSGALISATHAVENNRDLFVVPASIFEKGFEGSNELLRQGAKAVICADDVIREYPYIDLEKAKETKNAGGIEGIDMEFLSADERAIVMMLDDGEMHIDDIARNMCKSSSEINTMMTMLEINGIVKKETGNTYHL